MPGQSRTRHDLTAAAIELFLTKGYDETTVDEIAEAAGVARRTFFRHFRSKEDVVFPDHDECLTRVEQILTGADPAQRPMAAIASATHLVMDMYADDPAASVQRYRLTRHVAALRDREITATSRYQRVFTSYLNRRSGGRPHSRLPDEVAAAAVVAAHNHVLRQWLRDGGKGDVRTELDRALTAVEASLGPWLAGEPAGASTPDEQVVVVIMRRGTPMWRVVQEVKATAADTFSAPDRATPHGPRPATDRTR
ncbi:TetR family transcriptional regulator [Dactylosporangium fulvum]|uniref:TetR family transcriptional regulator n=1 Tax=Dactylosporangium fulvum TaxID=53359 RepID=A0ABY5WBP3_9ACTN|nr:TetR family transcriptional regulator [Dactylosporangium fulvum]UWP85511.1 TetR family transcriptional regulator [Dactylosporangium fulvum]